VPSRVPWIDATKGIGILLVVYGHVHLGLRSAGLVSDASPLQTLTDAIYTFHMPLFFFLAGMFARQTLAKGEAHFWRTKVALIFYAYILWSLLQGGMQIAFAEASNHPPSLSAIASILWVPIAQFWFLYALLWCRIAFAVMRRLSDGTILVIAASAFAVTFWIDLPVLGIVLWSFFYFALGLALSSRTLAPLPAGVGGVILALSPFVIFGAALGDWSEPAKVPAALCGIIATLFLAQRVAWRSGTLCLLGRLSMSIFVMHVIAAAAVRSLLTTVLGIENVALHLALGTGCGVGLPVLAVAVLDRARLTAWLGLSGDFPVRGPALGAGASVSGRTAA
jgi:surface polysaccharide O-acyltransferase-like enzyme